MDCYSHVKSLDGIGYFKSKPVDFTLGITTPKTMEIVEVILKGYGRYQYPQASSKKQPGVIPNSIRLGPGAIIWHTEGSVTLKNPDEANPYECMFFHFMVTQPRAFQIPAVSQWADLAECSAFCWEILSLFHRHSCDPKITGLYAYARLLWEVEKSAGRQAYDAMPMHVQKMVQSISDEPEKDWSVKRLGDVAGISESHVYLLFRDYLKTSPHDYVCTHRLNKAKVLLATTPLRVKEICHTCGFSGTAHFIRLFRKRLGMTPLAYRVKFSAP